MSVRIALFATALAAAAAVAIGPGASTAQACGSFWNIPVSNACQFYDPGEGHSEYLFTYSGFEETYETFSVYSDILEFVTTAGGSWTYSATNCSGCWATWWFPAGDSSRKIGCYNHHPGTMFVNCHHNNA
jgi:hypothetical protein